MIAEPISHDAELQGKINHACNIIEQGLANYKNHAILCSFGKDSMLMLHMVREWFTKDLPIIWIKQPYFPRKFAFGDKQVADLELDVHSNIPPVGVSITSKNGKSELVQHYAMGRKHLLMPLGRQTIENRPRWLCATDTVLKGPFGAYDWPWDLAFCGHKGSDVDPVQGEVPLQCDIHQIAGSCDLAYPLRYFTDDDVWRLTEKWNIPVNRLQYGSVEERSQDTENAFNSDYAPYCMACCDPNEAAFVRCPKTGLMITNISQSINQVDPKLAYCSRGA